MYVPPPQTINFWNLEDCAPQEFDSLHYHEYSFDQIMQLLHESSDFRSWLYSSSGHFQLIGNRLIALLCEEEQNCDPSFYEHDVLFVEFFHSMPEIWYQCPLNYHLLPEVTFTGCFKQQDKGSVFLKLSKQSFPLIMIRCFREQKILNSSSDLSSSIFSSWGFQALPSQAFQRYWALPRDISRYIERQSKTPDTAYKALPKIRRYDPTPDLALFNLHPFATFPDVERQFDHVCRQINSQPGENSCTLLPFLIAKKHLFAHFNKSSKSL
jgi:hypothetical protein